MTDAPRQPRKTKDGKNEKDPAFAEALELLRPFADESYKAGPQHTFVSISLTHCDAARAFVEKHKGG